jgi:hypothetical protein
MGEGRNSRKIFWENLIILLDGDGNVVAMKQNGLNQLVTKFCGEAIILYYAEPFLDNGSVNAFPRQRMRYCWKRCLLLGPCKRGYKEDS